MADKKFDYLSAKKEGYSDDEISSYLKESGIDFDLKGAKSEGYSDDEINSFLNQQPSVKKKVQGGTSPSGVSQSDTQNTKTEAPTSVSSIPLSGNQFYAATSGIETPITKQSKFEKKYSKSEVNNEDKKNQILKVLEKAVPGVDLNQPYVNEFADQEIKKNSKQWEDIAISQKEREFTNNQVKESGLIDIVDYAKEKIESSRDSETDLYKFKQSKTGKVYELINAVNNGEPISNEDEAYLRNSAPKVVSELMQMFPNAKTLNDASAIKSQQNKEEFLASSNEDIKQRESQFTPELKEKLGTSEIGKEIKIFNDRFDTLISALENKYPDEVYYVRTADGNTRKTRKSQAYNDAVSEIEKARTKLNQDIALANGYEYALKNQTSATSESVGEQVYKLLDPIKFNNYLTGGKNDKETKAEINKIGMNVLQSTGNDKLIQIGIKDEKEFDKKFPQSLELETRRRIGIEFLKQNGGANYLVNDNRIPVEEVDKIVDQLPKKYKDYYLNTLRNKSIPKIIFGNASNEYIKQNSVVEVPAMGGVVNSLFEGMATPIIGLSNLIDGLNDTKKEKANKAIAQPSLWQQKLIDRTRSEERVKDLENKPTLSIQEINELNNEKRNLKLKTQGQEFADGTFNLLGNVIGYAIGTKGIGAGISTIGKGIEATSVISRASQLGAIAENANKLKNIATYVSEAKNANNIGGMMFGYLSSYDDAEKEAINLGLSGWKQKVFANTVAGLNAASERIFKDEKVFDAFKREVNPALATIVNGIDTRTITDATLSKEIKNLLTKTLPKYATNIAIENQKEAIEEMATQLGTSISKAILAPDKFNLDEEAKAMKQVWWETSIYGSLTGIAAGVGETRRSTISKKALYDLGSKDENIKQFTDVINAQVAQGKMPQQEADAKIKIANTLREITKNTLPVIESKKQLTEDEKIKLTSILLSERQLRNEIADDKYIDVKKLNEQELQKVEKLKNDILEGKVVVDDNLNVYTEQEWNQNRNGQTTVSKAVIEIGGKMYEGDNHAQAIQSAKDAGEDISQIDRQRDGKFKLSDGTIIDREEAKNKFGQDRSELLISQDEAANQANKDYYAALAPTIPSRNNDLIAKHFSDEEKEAYAKLEPESDEAKQMIKDKRIELTNISNAEVGSSGQATITAEATTETAPTLNNKNNDNTRKQTIGEISATEGVAATIEPHLRANNRAAKEKENATWRKPDGLRELIDRAKQLGSYLVPKDVSEIVGKFINKGTENKVYLSKDGKSVIKINDFSFVNEGGEKFDNIRGLDYFFDRIAAHNEAFPEDSYKILGFTEDSEGKPKVILEQKYVESDAHPASQEDIDKELAKRGYEKKELSGGYHSGVGYTNGKFEITDAKPANVLIDKEGNYHFIDIDISRVGESEYVPIEEKLKAARDKQAELSKASEVEERAKRLRNVVAASPEATTEDKQSVDQQYEEAVAERERIAKEVDDAIQATKDAEERAKKLRESIPSVEVKPLEITPPTIEDNLKAARDEQAKKEKVNEVDDKAKDLRGKLNPPKAAAAEQPKEEKTKTQDNGKQPVLFAEDEREDELAKSKLEKQDNPIIEPSIEAIEGKAESDDKVKLKEVVKAVDEMLEVATAVVIAPISEIKINEKEYQGRKAKFSERSANNVHKNFDKNEFDPIIIYKHPDGNTYVLSGHSRLEGMKRRGEVTIPARYFEGTPQKAKEFALKSNKLATLQTDLENADYYRKKREAGESHNAILSEAKKNEQEGSAVRIIDYSYLNPKGKAYQALEALEKGESDSTDNVKMISQKVGRLRSLNPHLTDAHENELFDYFSKEGYPTDKEIQDQNNTINRSINAAKFDATEPLNLNKFSLKSPQRIEWENERDAFIKDIADLKKEVNPSKITGWSGLKERAIAVLSQGKSKDAIEQAEKDFNNDKNGVKTAYEKQLETKKQILKVLQDKLAKHLLREKSLIEGDKAQGALFMATNDPVTIAEQQLTAAKKELDKKRREFYGEVMNGVDDLFGSNVKPNLFGDNLSAVNLKDAQKALEPYKAKVEAARKNLEQVKRDAATQQTLFSKTPFKKVISKEAFNKLVERLKKAFPNTNVFTDKKLFEQKLKEAGYSDTNFNAVGNIGANNTKDAIESFEKAKDLNSKGVDMEQVFKETGWYIDELDKKWKYELPYENAKYTPIHSNKEYSARLGQVLDYPELYQAYPELKSIKIKFTKLKGRTNGTYDPKTKTIEINSEISNQLQESFIRHEVQHYIQQREGFAKGANPRVEGVQQLARRIEQNRARIGELKAILRTLPKNATDFNSLSSELKIKEDVLDFFENNQDAAAMYFYQAYAGEIEARNIQKRIEAKERKNGSPNKTRDRYTDGHTTVEFLKTPKGVVYGAAFPDGSIYINPDFLNANAPIHEYSHIFEKLNPTAWAKGVSIIKDSKAGRELFASLRANDAYANKTDEQIWSEALNTFVGNKGEDIHQQTTLARFKDWLKYFFNGIANKLGIKLSPDTSLEVFARDVVGKLLGGKEIVNEVKQDENKSIDNVMLKATKEAENITLKYNKQGQHLAPNGKPSNLTEQQAKIVRTSAFKNWFGDWENDAKNASKIVDENGDPLVVYHGTASKFNKFDKNKLGSNTGAEASEKGFFVSSNKNIANSYKKAHQLENPNLKKLKNSLSKLTITQLKEFTKDVMGYDVTYFDDVFYTKDLIEGELFREIEIDSEGYYEDRRKLIEKASVFLKQKGIEFSPYKDTGMLIEGFLNIRNPYNFDATGHSVMDIDLPEIIDESISKNKDGILVKNVHDSVTFEYKGNDSEEGDIMVFFNPNQIKLADGSNTTFSPETNDIRYMSLPDGRQLKQTEDGTPYVSESTGDYAQGNLFESTKEKGKEFLNVQAVWRKEKNVNMTGTTKVKNAADVAEIFKFLENKSVENFYAVHVDATGKSHIQHISTGGMTGTVVDQRILLNGVKKFGTKKMYFVHNHPSGNMKPSEPDLRLTKNARIYLNELGVSMEHVIMDTYKKEYVIIDEYNDARVTTRNERTDSVKLSYHVMDEQKILSEPISKPTNSREVVSFIQQLRFTAMPKTGMLLLNQGNGIIGNYILSDTDSAKEVLSFIGNAATGSNVIFYGNNDLRISEINKIGDVLAAADIKILDVVQLSSNNDDIAGYYKSRADGDLLNEHQQAYGTTLQESENNYQSQIKKIKDDATEIITGRKEIRRLSKQAEGGRKQGGIRNVEATILLTTGNGRNGKIEGREAQQQAIENYAKEEGIWIDNIEEEPEVGTEHNGLGTFVDSGVENQVYIPDDNPNIVRKAMRTTDPFNKENPNEVLYHLDTRISEHNAGIGSTVPYTVVGFGRLSNGDFVVITEQPRVIKSRLATDEEIKAEMLKMGYEQDGKHSFGDENHFITDVNPKNVLVDQQGNLHFIDTLYDILYEVNEEPNSDVEFMASTEELQNEFPELDEKRIEQVKSAFSSGQTRDEIVNRTNQFVKNDLMDKEEADQIVALFDKLNEQPKHTDRVAGFRVKPKQQEAAPQESLKEGSEELAIEELLNETMIESLPNGNDNKVFKQITAETTGKVEDRDVPGDYISLTLERMRELASQKATQLENLLGDKWIQKTISFMEKYPKRGDIPYRIGVLNMISTAINQQLNQTSSIDKIDELKKLQSRVDVVTNEVSRQASLGLNMRRNLIAFANGAKISDIIASTILTPEQQDAVRQARKDFNLIPTDEELNSALEPIKPPRQPIVSSKPRKSEKTKNVIDRLKNAISSKATKDEQGIGVKKTLSDKITDLKTAIKDKKNKC